MPGWELIPVSARLQLPARSRRGDIVEIRLIIQHPMETGFRYDSLGQRTPRNAIRTVALAGCPVALKPDALQFNGLNDCKGHQQKQCCCGYCYSHTVTANIFANAIRCARRVRIHRLIAQVSFDVGGQFQGCGVTPTAIFLKRFERNGVGIAA